MEKDIYTAGELAKIAGVSIRTIRFYDTKGVLKPVQYSDGGYRLYNNNSLIDIQKILMLKYLGFSLANIIQIMNNGLTLKESLKKQKKLLIRKQEHLSRIIDATDELEKSNMINEWDKVIHVINLLGQKEDIVNQYYADTNLKNRINIHDKYSINKYGWHKWVFDKLEIKKGMKILELGCGSADLWLKNIKRIPEDVSITLSDYSYGMIEKSKYSISKYRDYSLKKNINFIYKRIDAENFKIDEGDFDIIIANHMLYYVKNKDALFANIKSILKENGKFFCSTIGNNHMNELVSIAEEFDSAIKFPSSDAVKDFSLENGKMQLEKYFSNVTEYDYEDALEVDDIDALYDYIYSAWGNVKSVIDNSKKSLKSFIKKKLEKGPMHITKSTGMFMCLLKNM